MRRVSLPVCGGVFVREKGRQRKLTANRFIGQKKFSLLKTGYSRLAGRKNNCNVDRSTNNKFHRAVGVVT